MSRVARMAHIAQWQSTAHGGGHGFEPHCGYELTPVNQTDKVSRMNTFFHLLPEDYPG
jgi:hypothetical protein